MRSLERQDEILQDVKVLIAIGLADDGAASGIGRAQRSGQFGPDSNTDMITIIINYRSDLSRSIHAGIMLDSCWIHVGIILKLCWIKPKMIQLDNDWNYVGIMVELCWIKAKVIPLDNNDTLKLKLLVELSVLEEDVDFELRMFGLVVVDDEDVVSGVSDFPAHIHHGIVDV